MQSIETWLEAKYPQSVRVAYLILGNRQDAEDAVQDAFLRAWRFRDSLKEESNFGPWLYRVVVNACNTKLRHEIPHRDRRRSDERLTTASSREDMVERITLTNDVVCAIHDLPNHLKVVIVLRYYADLSERDIAIAVGRKPGTVKSRLHEARRQLATHPSLRAMTNDTMRMNEGESG